MWPRGRLNRSEPSSDDEWRHSLKMMVNYEDDYKNTHTPSYRNKTMLFLSSERLSLSCARPHWIAIVTIHVPTLTVKWHKWILTFKFETMLLSEA